jgi:hypothetical protein
MNMVCPEKESLVGGIASTILPIVVAVFFSIIFPKNLPLGKILGWFPGIMQDICMEKRKWFQLEFNPEGIERL